MSVISKLFVVSLFFGLFVSVAQAQLLVSDNNTKITFVVVNGGLDSPNPGVTCIQVSDPLSASCTKGYVAIKGSNKELLSAALHAKATGSNIWLNYDDAAGQQHCPGITYTNCAVSSIGLK